MALKPANFEWLGFSDEERRLLNLIDHVGNNGWGRNGQTDAMMPAVLDKWAATGRSFQELQEAMASIGYDRRNLHQLARWESKRTTGKFGR